MTRNFQAFRAPVAVLGLFAVLAFAVGPFPVESPASEQVPANVELPTELQYVPVDAALFLSVEAAQMWDNPILKTIRKSDAKMFDDLASAAKKAFGFTPDDVKSLVLFVPKVQFGEDPPPFGVVITMRNAYDKEKIAKSVEKLVSKKVKINVVAANDRTAMVLVNLDDKYAKPQPADKTGPLTSALQAAATGKHAVVMGMSPVSLPDELRSDDVPQLRQFQPLFKAVAITAMLDLGKSFDLNLRVKTGTAVQAGECEKAIGSFLSLFEEAFAEELKAVEVDAAKKPSFKDLFTIMKAVSSAMKEAKFSTLGNETQLTLSLPTNLPFTGAYFAAKEKVEEEMTVIASSNNLKQIALAAINYADAMNGNLPPAAVCDKTGKPLLSWRVLILPYIDQEKLFKEFKLDEPWDSEHNKKLLVKMPKIYAIPGKTKPGETDTHYRVFVGKSSGWDWIQGVRFPASFLDGTSNTVMCVTAAEAVPWTKPDELTFDPDKDMRKLLGAVVNGKLQVAMFDGSVHTLKKIPSKETVNALITRDGGEVIGPDFP